MKTLKPAHIVTDTPEEFVSVIQRWSDAFSKVTAGPNIPDGVKYVFRNLKPEVDLLALVDALRRTGKDSLKTGNGQVERYKKPLIKATTIPQPPQTIVKPTKQTKALQTALIMCAYGQGAARITATREGLKQLLCLNPMPRIVFVELLWRGEKSAYSDLLYSMDIDHTIIRAKDNNRVLFQKEACFNKGAKLAIEDGCDTLVFHDPDCYPTDPQWIANIHNSLQKYPDTIFQAWSIYRDTIAVTHQNVQSYTAAKEDGLQNVLRAPGLAWAMAVDRYLEIRGFNPFFAPGGGDAGFVFDVDESPVLSLAPFSWPWWVKIHGMRDVAKGPVGCVQAEMIHINHGPFPERAYYWRNMALTHLSEDICPAITMDDQGLVATTDTALARQLIYILSRKAMMTDEKSMFQVVEAAKKER